MITLHELVADKLERADEASRVKLLRIALDNIERWLANGHSSPHRLEEWRQIILRSEATPEGFQEMLALLRDRGEQTQRLRDFAPFAGILTAAERLFVIRQCVYSH